MSKENAAKMRSDGMPIGTPFSKDNPPRNQGRPAGSFSLETRVRNLLEDTEKLPRPIREAIRAQCGDDVKAIDAVMIVGLLQALQGDKGWAEFITNRGWGKVPDKTEHSGSIEMPSNRKGVVERLLERNRK